MVPSVPPVAYMPFIIGALPFVVSIVIIVVLFRYFLAKKRLEHQQIMAAIEKGTPLSEIRPVELKKKEINWIKSLTTGIALLLMGTGIVIVSLYIPSDDEDDIFGLLIASIVLLAIGAGGIVRGILQRKYDKALSSDKSALNANQRQ